MSAETLEWLNTNVLVGQVARDGRPWHYNEIYQGQLTNLYDGFIPVADVISRLFDWQAVERDLGYRTTDVIPGSDDTVDFWTPIEGQKVIVNSKTGETYGLFKSGYRIHQYNEWLLENVATILDVAQGDLGISAAGLLRNGGRAWVQIEPAHSSSVGGTFVQRFLTASTSHDGTSATKYIKGDNISVCDNTLDFALGAAARAGYRFTFKHTKNSPDRVGEVRHALEVVFAHTDERDAEIERLMNTTMTDQQFWNIVEGEFPKAVDLSTKGAKAANTKRDATVGTFARLWHHDTRVSPWKNTAWGTLMAFNTYDQWESGLKGVDRPERNQLAFLDGKRAERDANIMNAIERELELVTN